MVEFQRAIAYKIWISDLLNGSYMKGSGQFDVGYVEVLGMKISKVNILGGLVDKFEGDNYVNVTVDDGSGNIRLKSWGEDGKVLRELNVGDLVLVVGKVKEYNNQIFVNPEIIKKLDNPLWLKVRRLELIKMYGETKRVESTNTDLEINSNVGEEMNPEIVEEKMIDESPSNSVETIISLIEKLDTGDGADTEEVIVRSAVKEANQIIQDLIKDGEVFELHKGKLRVMG